MTDGGARRRALAVTVSNRAHAGVYEDRGGPLVAAALRDLGFDVDGPRVVPDGDPVEAALREAAAEGYDVVVTTGGTGLTPMDLTPEMTRRVIDREIPGIAEAIRAEGRAKVPTAVLSRGLAGLAGRTLVVNLPGSTGGVRDGLAVLAPLLDHAVDQAHGGDHARAPGGPASGGGPGGHGPGAGSAAHGGHGGHGAGPGERGGSSAHGGPDGGPHRDPHRHGASDGHGGGR